MRGRLILTLVIVFLASCTIPAEYKDSDFCKRDTDCVRQGSCCDCSIGTYVNTYHYSPKNCEVECECEALDSRGVCENNKCAGKPVGSGSKTYCETTVDCICGGVDEETRDCFIGNKEYYSEYVDKTMECSDFCTGIGGHLETSCIDNECRLIPRSVDDNVEYHWKCKNGLFVKSPGDCYENVCSKDSECALKLQKGECGKEYVAVPSHVFTSEFVSKRCNGDDCHFLTPICDSGLDLEFEAKCVKGSCELVELGEGPECVVDSDCATAGCSGTLCLPKKEASDTFTTCVWLPEYACYRGAHCECSNGVCGWDNNENFLACMEEKKE